MKYTILIVLFFMFFVSQSQECNNLISNHTFDIHGTNNEDHPLEDAMADKLEDWVTEKNNTQYATYHSPDWFDANQSSGSQTLFATQFSSPNGGAPLYGSDGNKYIGMTNNELIQQKFGTSSATQLEDGTDYIVTFDVYQQNYHSWVNREGGGYVISQIADYRDANGNVDMSIIDPDNDGVRIKVFLAKNRLRYSDNEEYTKSNGATEFMEIQSFNIDPVNDPLDMWREFTFSFTSPSNNADAWKWLAIEIQIGNDQEGGYYMYFDNIRLSKGCLSSCSSTDGCIPDVIIANHIINDEHGVIIEGLDNVTDMTINITTTSGAQTSLPTLVYHCPNGLKKVEFSDVYELSNGNGADGLPTVGNYLMTLDLDNDCESRTIQNIMIHKEQNHDSIIPYNGCYYESMKVPTLCCELEPDLAYNGHTFSGGSNDDHLTLHALNSIKMSELTGTGTGVRVTSHGSLTLKAGNEITFYPGFTTDNDAILDAFIESCDQTTRSLFDDIENDYKVVFDSHVQDENEITLGEHIDPIWKEVKVQEKKLETFNISLYPNPTSDVLNIDISIPCEKAILDIYSIEGKILSQKIYNNSNNMVLDVSNFENGIYIMIMNIDGIEVNRKFNVNR